MLSPNRVPIQSSLRTLLFPLMAAIAFAVIPCHAAEGDAAAPVVVLDTTGFWRNYNVLQPPVVQSGNGLERLKDVTGERTWKTERDYLNRQTPLPPADWMAPAFDDGNWSRGPALNHARTTHLGRLYLRGKFSVTDPGKVGALRLSVGYCGGAIVYVNGKEVARQHVAGDGVIADAYPDEAFLAPDGTLFSADSAELRTPRGKLDEETSRRRALRTREIKEIAIPADLLVKGVNVVAIEIVRAPLHRKIRDSYAKAQIYETYAIYWFTCALNRVQVTASHAAGLVPNATRPKGLQVWNGDIHAPDYDLDFGDPNETLRPVRIAGVRNGQFSGKVVVGSDAPIDGLGVTAGGLSGGGGTIPASAVHIRYGLSTVTDPNRLHKATRPPRDERSAVFPSPYPVSTFVLDSLADAPLRKFPIKNAKSAEQNADLCIRTPGQPQPVLGAVVPVWITVNVPSEAKAGIYKGEVTVSCDGHAPVNVPIELTVDDWTLPNPQDYRTWMDLVQSPDTLSMTYKCDLWSDRHFELMGRTMRLLQPIGVRTLYIPLLSRTHLGNAESMVRWIPKGEGRYEFDFSVMDRYIDLAVKNMGQPKLIGFVAYDVIVDPKWKQYRANVVVTGLLPATGKTEELEVPFFADAAAARPLWKDLFDQLRQRMKARGLEDAMMLGLLSDRTAPPTKEVVGFLGDVTGNLPWNCFAHFMEVTSTWKLHDSALIRYQAIGRAFQPPPFGPPEYSHYGWKREQLLATGDRVAGNNRRDPNFTRNLPEYCIAGDRRGMGWFGADAWDPGLHSRTPGIFGRRYPDTTWHNMTLATAFLAPGPDGPVATSYYEVMREGVQDCEARIALERALTDGSSRQRLPPALVARCEDTLRERTLHVNLATSVGDNPYGTEDWDQHVDLSAGGVWFVHSGWQERNRRLYALAGEVKKSLAAAK